MAYEEREQKPSTSDVLLMGLGTDPADIAEGKINMARMGIIMDPENVPESFRSWVYWDLCAKLLGDEFAQAMHDIGLDHTVGIGGRGRVDSIKGASVGQGGPVQTEADIIKPGWIVRNTINRDWEAKERQRLGLPPAPAE